LQSHDFGEAPLAYLRESLTVFDNFLAQEKLSIPPNSELAPQFSLVRQFLTDLSNLGSAATASKWTEFDFKPLYDAAIVVLRLSNAVAALRDDRVALRRRLTTIFSGGLTQNLLPDQAKDHFYELEIGASLKRAGFTVALREPDIIVSGAGLTQEIGLACKYPSSEARIHQSISKGYQQITGQRLAGCVVLGLDLIVLRGNLNASPPFMDFGRSDDPHHHLLNPLMENMTATLRGQRSTDYPSERPLDGVILTFTLWGMFAEPRRFGSVTSWSVQCEPNNPIRADLELIVERGRSLDTERSPDEVH
jgi:hypothetical protein